MQPSCTRRTHRVKIHLYRDVTPEMLEAIYDEIEIEDFTFDPVTQLFQYPCPCGDSFAVLIDDLEDGEDIAVCPLCSLMVRVIFEPEDLKEYREQLE